ncbi:Short-chain dehydrogenase/reductase ATR7 [Paramyrothecium foliicola]|nr:Short-chain dehydrogenase/reductase ATR7 [Paramyrothecium foliicola]
MASLNITDNDIPELADKVAIVTGGGSGIGLAAVRLMARKGARVFILDLNAPDADTIPVPLEGESVLPSNVTFFPCNVSKWADLRAAFRRATSEAGRLDIVIANAGVSEEYDYFEDQLGDDGELLEPKYGVVDVNFRGVVNCVKLGVSQMRKQRKAGDAAGGSIVITSSATAYAPEHNLPVYSASKAATVGLLRGLRSRLVQDDITINSVAPAATITKLLPGNLAAPMMAVGLPVSSAEFVGRALVYSATAQQKNRVENYGKDSLSTDGPGRWNGRTILTLGDEYVELEEPHASLKPFWLGWKSSELTKRQQAVTDFRQV